MNGGVIDQVGSPRDVYELPSTPFVAGFIGTSNVIIRNGRMQSIRPERVQLLPASSSPPTDVIVEPGTVTDVVFLGMVSKFFVKLNCGDELVAVQTNDGTSTTLPPATIGDAILVFWRSADAFDLQTAVA
jgi:putative spermidine/putrescine transport system ATP-binding protein